MNYENMDKKMLIEILNEKDTIIRKLCLERERLNYYANIDCITGVLNRRAGLKLLEKEIDLSKTNNKSLTVCFIDIDRFKKINDKFGHQEGDRVLKKIGRLLGECIRKTDIVMRIGGDEFLIVFSETTIEGVKRVWSRISDELYQINTNQNYDYNISLSYGFSECRKGDEITVEELIKRADKEMYRRKRNDFNISSLNKL